MNQNKPSLDRNLIHELGYGRYGQMDCVFVVFNPFDFHRKWNYTCVGQLGDVFLTCKHVFNSLFAEDLQLETPKSMDKTSKIEWSHFRKTPFLSFCFFNPMRNCADRTTLMEGGPKVLMQTRKRKNSILFSSISIDFCCVVKVLQTENQFLWELLRSYFFQILPVFHCGGSFALEYFMVSVLVASCKCKPHVRSMKDIRGSVFFEKKTVRINNIQYDENL